jgi:hypothetical protein
MSRPLSNKFFRFPLFVIGVGAIATGGWLLFVAEPTIQATGSGLAALAIGGYSIFRLIHKETIEELINGPQSDLGSEHLAPHDPLAWLDEAKKVEAAKNEAAQKEVNKNEELHSQEPSQ